VSSIVSNTVIHAQSQSQAESNYNSHQQKQSIMYSAYIDIVDKVGESILDWADPENKFRGYTEVRFVSMCFVGLFRPPRWQTRG